MALASIRVAVPCRWDLLGSRVAEDDYRSVNSRGAQVAQQTRPHFSNEHYLSIPADFR